MIKPRVSFDMMHHERSNGVVGRKEVDIELDEQRENFELMQQIAKG